MGRIGTDRFCERPNTVERHLGGAVLEHRDDVGFLEAAFFGDFALGLVALGETVSDEIGNGGAMGQVCRSEERRVGKECRSRGLASH